MPGTLRLTICSDILKMDIEFSEFSSLTSLEEAFPASKGSFPIGQLLVEIHLFEYKHEMNPAVFLKWSVTLIYQL